MAAQSDTKGILKQLKAQQQQQLSRLQAKADAEVELLEVVGAYFKRRAEIEAQYATSLEKLGKQYQTKKFKRSTASGTPNQTPLSGDSAVGAIYVAFSTVLLESEKQARKRGQIGDQLNAEIADFLKDFTKSQGGGAKRNLDFGSRYQQELWATYDDLEKTKQAYEKAAKETDAAHRKYDEISRKPGSGLSAIKNLVTGTDSEERVSKQRSKWKSLSRKLNDARNEYLLALQAVNSIQQTYYKEELPQLMQNLDGSFYSAYPSALDKYTNMESEFTAVLNSAVETLRETVKGMERGKESEAFMREHQGVFQDPSTFYFESHAGDDVTEIIVDDVTKVALGHRLGRLKVQESQVISDIGQRERELGGVAQMADVYAQTPSFGNAASPLEQRQEIENSLRLLTALKARTSAQVQVLQEKGVQPIMPALPTAATPGSAGAHHPSHLDKPTAHAVYDYDAKGDGEISLRSGDELVVLVPEKDGWIKVRNVAGGASGLVPATYIKEIVGGGSGAAGAGGVVVNQAAAAMSKRASVITTAGGGGGARQVKAIYDFTATDEGELTFKAGDIIDVLDTGNDFSDEAWWEGRLPRTNQSGQFPIVFTQGWQALQGLDNGFGGGALPSLGRPAGVESVAQAAASRRESMMSRRTSALPAKSAGVSASSAASAGVRVRALFAYQSTCDGELSMEIGDVISVVSKNTGSDAWWEGESSRGKGQFPVNYVEQIEDNARPLSGLASHRASIVPAAAVAATPQVKALYDYTAGAPDEISFKAGAIIRLTDSSDSDWFVGELNGQTGAFPANYVQRV
ncbi:uncharacterized protein EV422DRAFT_570810 [Fimicolochytrium jonesii]|uniref:uncharacterized protein n=1 Tax=Fimicolochytrium jonesii TaxID=1396493 RepID=UPI0022FE8F17|nr:uncharacterized protein EV422DRAFT_570810 [Fimicolochytrium jonesii]KAI8817468.1 hypothetical protein EV422DRAFT_570810 [Fimicolochytrium jonesii]